MSRAVIGGLSMGGYAALALLQSAPQVIEAPRAGRHARHRRHA